MKVILSEEVVGLGEPGKVVDVAPGYARNYLIPRKLAVYANEGRVKELEHNKRRLERKRQQLQAVAAARRRRSPRNRLPSRRTPARAAACSAR